MPDEIFKKLKSKITPAFAACLFVVIRFRLCPLISTA